MMARYSKGGNWVPSIPGMKCEMCGVIFTGRRKTQQFCSNECKAAARSLKMREAWVYRTCPGCNGQMHVHPNDKSQYCSKECRYKTGSWKKPTEFSCEVCDAVFTTRLREGVQERKYCSEKCRHIGMRKPVEADCVNCGTSFTITPCRSDKTCSKECAHEFYTRERAAAWKGGIYYTGDYKRRRIDRPGYAAKYEGEHRLIAGRAIGRPIGRGELVIHLDRDHTNNDPTNLFVCGSMSEFGKRRFGSLPWPTHSNLDTYNREGYDVLEAGLLKADA